MKEEMTIKVKYFPDCTYEIQEFDKGDWIDLRAAVKKPLIMKSGDFAMIPLGVAMELPEGYEAHVVPRSSTFKNFGIIQANSLGIIDHSYCGDGDEWMFPAIALRDTMIPVGARICQFRIVENQPKVRFEEVRKLSGDDRGGFGSSGIL